MRQPEPRDLPPGKGSPDPGGTRPGVVSYASASPANWAEGYPAGWLHAYIHLSPDTGEMHSDGDHRVREWIEERITRSNASTLLLQDAPEVILRRFVRQHGHSGLSPITEAEACIDGLVLQRDRAASALAALREALAAYWRGDTDDVPREPEARSEQAQP